MDSLGLQVLAEACRTCDESYSNSSDADDNNKENVYFDQNQNASPLFTLYCKARGTPLDHQEDRAILQFSSGEEFKHGADLVCSHLVCRQNGVKFRYCAHCKKAVAKRNFRKRHAHTDLMILEHTTSTDTKMMDCNIPAEPHHPKQLIQQPPLHLGDIKQTTKKPPSQMQTQQERKPLHPICTEAFGFQNEQRQYTHESQLVETCFSTNHTTKMGLCSSPKQTHKDTVPEEWIELYHQRPKKVNTPDATIEWISRVKQIAGITMHPTSMHSTGNVSENQYTRIYLQDTSAFTSSTSALSPFEELSSSSLSYYDQMFNEVKEEFKGMAPPRLQNLLSTNNSRNIAKFRQHAESLSLQINTDVDASSSSSVRMLDSEGSMMITPKSFMS